MKFPTDNQYGNACLQRKHRDMDLFMAHSFPSVPMLSCVILSSWGFREMRAVDTVINNMYYLCYNTEFT